MSRLRLFFSALVFLVLVSFVGAGPKTVKVGAFNYYPGIFRAADGRIQGSFADILGEIARKEGWTLEFVYGSWAEGLDRLRSGEVDILTSVAKTDERLAYMDYASVPLLTVWSQVYVPRDSRRNSILEMRGARVAVMKGDFNAAGFRNLVQNFRIDCTLVEVADFEAVFRALEEGRADAGVVNSVFGSGMSGRFAVKHTSVVFNPFDIYFTVAKGRNADVLGALDRTMEAWSKEGPSFQQEAIEKWAPGTVNQVRVVPEWLIALLVGGAVLLVLGGAFILLLRYQVRQASRKVQAILDALNDSLFVHDLETGAILEANACATRMYGYGPGEWGGLSIGALSIAEEGYTQEAALRYLVRAREGGVQQFEWRARHRSGRPFWVEVSMSLVSIRGKGRALVLVRDITERKQSYEVLARAQKLESIGVLAGGIAHDFNNLLGGIFGYLELVDLRLAHGEPAMARASLTKALGVFDRARSLTKQLLTFAKGGHPVLEWTDLGNLVREAVAFSLSGSNLQARFTVAPDLPRCAVDPAQLSQVIDNLVINAKQAMPDGGTLHVRVGETEREGERWFLVSIIDQGPGIMPSILPQIFDPFFTTKRSGSGLGLSMCWSIVKRHGGILEALSEPGQGAEFRILLPPSSPTPAPGAPLPPPAADPSRPALRVLVMDDEDYNREILCEQLKVLGCQVEAVGDGAALLAAHKAALARGTPPDLILLDRTVPGGMGGLEAAVLLRGLDRQVVLVIMSGYSDDAVLSDPGAHGFAGALQKPVRAEELEKLVRSLS